MCIGTILVKHRPKERDTKRFQVEISLGIFQGGEEEVERGEDKKTISTTHQCKDPNKH
jgi:hypothetical protein